MGEGRTQDIADLVATPNPVPYGEGPGATTITWSTGDGSPGQVYLSVDGGPEQLFAGGSSGSQEAPWISAGATYEFRLYAGDTNRTAPLSTVVVTQSDIPWEIEEPIPYASREEHPNDVASDQLSSEVSIREPPVVSVVIPCYNQAYFLGEAIESVLAQSYPLFEVVVVDDGSTDNTSEVAARYPEVRCVRQNNQGLAAARNSGLRESSGSYLVFLNADDRLLPEALEVGLEQLSAHPECAFACGRCNYIAANGALLVESPPADIEGNYYLTFLSTFWVHPDSVMYRRAVLESVGGFDSSVKAAEDVDIYLRIAREFPLYFHNKVVVEVRHHSTQTTGNKALMLRHSVAVLRSQRMYVERDRRYKTAYQAGIRLVQEDIRRALNE